MPKKEESVAQEEMCEPKKNTFIMQSHDSSDPIQGVMHRAGREL